MQLTLTPRATTKILDIIAEKGGHLALRIKVRKLLGSFNWEMSLQPHGADLVYVNSVPLDLDATSRQHLDGLVIDWVQTPEGPGFGIYGRDLNTYT